MPQRLDLCPIDGVGDDLLLMLAHRLSDATGLSVAAARSRPMPVPIDPIRRQYDAAALLERLAARRDDPSACVLGVTVDDVYASGMNFVFGLADPEHQVAVVSLARLASTDRALAQLRLVKEALHQTGLALGLPYCPRACVMRFADSLLALDARPATFCEECRLRLGARTGLRAV
ncbi:MAG TPA: hypothetical protein VIO14_09045 [Dehalococcoidia bacterium]